MRSKIECVEQVFEKNDKRLKWWWICLPSVRVK